MQRRGGVGRRAVVGLTVAAAVASVAMPAEATEYLQSGDLTGVLEGGTVVYPSGDGVDEPYAVASGSLRRSALRRFSLACGGTDPESRAGIAPARLGTVIENGGQRIWLLGTVQGTGALGSLCDQARRVRPTGPRHVVLVSNDAGRSFGLAPPPPPLTGLPVERAPVLRSAPDGRGVIFGSPAAGWYRYSQGSPAWSGRTFVGARFGLHREPPRTEWELGPPYNARLRGSYEPAMSRALNDAPAPRVFTEWNNVKRSVAATVFTIRRGRRPLRTVRARLRVRARRVLVVDPGPCRPPPTGLSLAVQRVVGTTNARTLWGVTSPVAVFRCQGKRKLMEARSRLVKSTNYGRTWKPLEAPRGELIAVTGVDGRTPIVATATCRNEYELRQYRRVGGRWRHLGCRPGN